MCVLINVLEMWVHGSDAKGGLGRCLLGWLGVHRFEARGRENVPQNGANSNRAVMYGWWFCEDRFVRITH